MNAVFRAFVETEVLRKYEKKFFKRWSGRRDIFDFLHNDPEFAKFWEFVVSFAEQSYKAETLSGYYKKIACKLGEIEGRPKIKVLAVEAKILGRGRWATIDKRIDLSGSIMGPFEIKIMVPRKRRIGQKITLLPRELYLLGHELGHLMVWMGNGEPGINQQLKDIKCLNNLSTLRSLKGYQGLDWARIEMICDVVGLIFLWKATQHLDLSLPVQAEFERNVPEPEK